MLNNVKEAFKKEIIKSEADINLAYAALLISEYLTQETEISSYLALLDQMADSVQSSVQAAGTDLEVVDVLNHHLFNEMNFSGNSINYYHPNNSFLNKVLELKTGIPIALSLVYLEVGKRLGLPLWGIGMPQHFIVGYGPSSNPIYIDVFNQGQILTEDDCLAIAQVSPSNRLSFKQEYLKPTTPKDILFRILLNLKQIYVSWEDWESAYKAVDLMVLTRPDEITEIRDRGLLAYRLDRLRDAIFDIERYLYLAPDSVDADWLKKRVEAIEEKLNRLN